MYKQRAFLFLLIFIIIQTVNAQSDYNVAVSLSKMNVFYIRVDNPIEIAVSDISNNDLSVTISQGMITKRKDSTYITRLDL